MFCLLSNLIFSSANSDFKKLCFDEKPEVPKSPNISLGFVLIPFILYFTINL